MTWNEQWERDSRPIYRALSRRRGGVLFLLAAAAGALGALALHWRRM